MGIVIIFRSIKNASNKGFPTAALTLYCVDCSACSLTSANTVCRAECKGKTVHTFVQESFLHMMEKSSK
jgi:hypothetical protein